MPVTIWPMGGDHTGIGMAEARSALAWWLESGVDVAVQEAPRNWLKPVPAAAIPVPEPARVADDAAPSNFDEFRSWLKTTPSLPLAALGGKRVLATGAEHAPIMLIADAPTEEEVAAGTPIAGEAWVLAQRMLAAIGIAADEAYVAPLNCFSSPGTKLGAADLEACAAIARRHVAMAKPKRLLLLGDGPARALLGKSLSDARAHVHKVEGVRTVATFSPRHLMNRPPHKALAWKDLLLLMEEEA